MADAVERDNIVIKNGRVQRVQHWVNWNGTLWPVITIARQDEGRFRSDIGDPEHGGGMRVGSFEDVTVGLHQNIQQMYRAPFDLVCATEDAVHRLKGFEKHLIMIE